MPKANHHAKRCGCKQDGRTPCWKQVARRQAVTNPGNTVRNGSVLLAAVGKTKKSSATLSLWATKSLKSGTSVKVKMGDKEYSAEELSAMVLSKLKADAERF